MGALKPRLPKGHLSILAPEFKYTNSHRTDVAATIARVRAENEPAPRQTVKVRLVRSIKP